MIKHVLYIGIIVFRLLKHSDELDIKPPTLLGGTTVLLGGGARPPVPPPPAGYGPVFQGFTNETMNVSHIPPKKAAHVKTVLRGKHVLLFCFRI